jgi:Domain of unknown function (DUF4070)
VPHQSEVAAIRSHPAIVKNAPRFDHRSEDRPPRIRTFLRENAPPRIAGALSWRYVMAFLFANFRLGFVGRERFQYWGLLLWTILRRPSHFSLAVGLSIYGYHFRKTCRVLGL